MLEIPEITQVDVAFGNVKHLPKYETLPKEFQRETDLHCRAVQNWFYEGAKAYPNGISINGQNFKARPGVDFTKALAAIRAALCSFEPKHEHKIAGCGFLLKEWFELES